MVVSVMCTPTDCAVMTSPQPRLAPAGRGAYAIRALPDLCLGIVSEGPGHLDPWIGQLLESLGCARGSLFYVSVRGATEPSASYCVGQLAITRPARLRQRAALRLVIQSQLQLQRLKACFFARVVSSHVHTHRLCCHDESPARLAPRNQAGRGAAARMRAARR